MSENSSEFWIPIFKNTDFEKYLSNKYSFQGREMDIKRGSLEELFE